MLVSLWLVRSFSDRLVIVVLYKRLVLGEPQRQLTQYSDGKGQRLVELRPDIEDQKGKPTRS